MIGRLLIANRGEIARRIIRTCRRVGVETVAIYSDADADAPHVHEANEACRVGPAPAAESYLHVGHVIEAARRANADAVHPGYGFLSENAGFAEACEVAGLLFVGPPSGVIRRMASKTAARDAARTAGVAVVPGRVSASQDLRGLADAVEAVGFPALIKATAGGGGRGMRTVRAAAGLPEALDAARREAAHAFGDGTLYVERLLDRPRHIEVQVLGDAHGGLVHLFERDCSLQRRHQKIVEEAPAPGLSPALRETLTRAAVGVARSVGYVNAGTVEFLVAGDACYFLEMNTRLQVEHPITEAITGLDLVELQLRVAAGERLPIGQDDVRVDGHAIEGRVYAEDARRLLPQAGRLLRYREPAGPGLRVDAGVAMGERITVHYDALLAKLVGHGPTRAAARARLLAGLGAYEILGVPHNLAFLRRILEHPAVVAGPTSTSFVDDHLSALLAAPPAAVARVAAAVAAIASSGPAPAVPSRSNAYDPWSLPGTLPPVT